MTTDERAFLDQLALDPYAQFTRLVYADWLADHDRTDDEQRQRGLAEGYAALRELERRPRDDGVTDQHPFEWWNEGNSDDNFRLPDDWFPFLQGGVPWNGSVCHEGSTIFSRDFATLAAALESAAFAFSLLPAERKAELLAKANVLPLSPTTLVG